MPLRKHLIKVTILTLPLYLVRVNLFGIPTNVSELLAIFSIVFSSKQLLQYLKNNTTYSFFGSIITFLALISAFNSNLNLASLSIIKSWIFIPFLFGITIITNFKRDSIDKLLSLFILSNLAISLIALTYKISDFLTFDGRLSAFYLSPNHLAMALAPGLLYSIYLSMTRPTKSILLSLFIQLLVLYFTFSYANWVAISISTLFLVMRNVALKRKRLYLLPFLFLLVFSFLQFNSAKFKSLTNLNERSSLSSRIMIWKSSFKLLDDNLIFGIGAGNFQEKYLEYQKYFPPYLEWAVPQPHNVFLAFWLQATVFGLITFLAYIFFIFKQLNKNKKITVLSAIFMYFVYFLVVGLVDTPFWKNDLAFHFWILSALLFTKD